jgi:hypothetical protein
MRRSHPRWTSSSDFRPGLAIGSHQPVRGAVPRGDTRGHEEPRRDTSRSHLVPTRGRRLPRTAWRRGPRPRCLHVEIEPELVAFHKPHEGIVPRVARDYGHSLDTPPICECAAWQLAKKLGDPHDRLVAVTVPGRGPDRRRSGVVERGIARAQTGWGPRSRVRHAARLASPAPGCSRTNPRRPRAARAYCGPGGHSRTLGRLS